MKVTITITLLLIFVSSNILGQTKPEFLEPVKIDTTEIRKYSDFKEMLNNETLDCLQEINTIEGFAFWGFKIGIKKWNNWIVIDQPNFNINVDCFIKFISADFMDINESGEPELILRFKKESYGNRGGIDLEYIQIWDTDSNVLILESLTKEKNLWFAKPEWKSICERKVEYEPGEIKFSQAKCDGDIDNFDLVNENKEKVYILNNGKFELK
jgi:hypothetical protein